ncbi:class A beta-lactamase, subclass A2 [Cloacibacterium normanense]|uniref:beta-lactamase n=1 Tax=Cloacibacterium normanense TaxID=237258 RepID=A0A1E5UHB1_9FLAO|nr:class A beta-lactamase, subclass A2 [Cloacibacterium normanense]AZI69014.1 class A beta-lactamase, subclass A2 [Cloacibacterium normanense]OEL12280.1 extended-spectrum beta-lactamase PER-1 [Cloacibacterium normanense]SDO60364.1 beta-lactamase class A [Cloacibacterium normanense]
MKKLTILFLLISIFCFAQKAELKKEISKITEGKKATVAVSVLGIDFPFQYNNNNAEKKLPMQSVFKYHIALAVLDLVDQGKLSLDQKVFIKKSELLPNTWSPIREKNPEGNFEMPISELIEYSVAMSDNVGCDVLLRLIGGPKVVHDFLIYKGAKDTQIVYNEEIMQSAWKNQYENYTTMKSATRLLKDFYKGKILSKKSTEFLLGVMYRTSTGLNKIVEQLPKSAKVAHKTGSSGKNNAGLTGAENDIAIITLPNGKTYAIAIFVSDSMETWEVNCKMISDISKVVFENLEK